MPCPWRIKPYNFLFCISQDKDYLPIAFKTLPSAITQSLGLSWISPVTVGLPLIVEGSRF